MTASWFVRTALVGAALGFSACASTASIRWERSRGAPTPPAQGPVAVMEPMVEGTASPGNVGRNFPAVKQEVRSRILSIVDGRVTTVDIAFAQPHLRTHALESYPAAVGGGAVTTVELDAANAAFEHGATYLIAPTILEWTEMRTDDPIGALVTSHNHIAIDLRLMRLQPPAQVAHVVFSNHSRLTLNQPASRLLDDSFRNVVLQLVAGLQ